MLFESRLHRLEARYRAALSAASAARQEATTLAEQSDSTASAIERAHAQWKALELRVRSIVEAGAGRQEDGDAP